MKIRKIYHSFFFLRCKLSLNKAILLSLLKNFGYPLSEFNEFEYGNPYISSFSILYSPYLDTRLKVKYLEWMYTCPKTRLDSLHFAAPYKELREIYVYIIYNETNKTSRTFQIFKNGHRACHYGPTCCPRSRVITSRIQKPNNVISF